MKRLAEALSPVNLLNGLAATAHVGVETKLAYGGGPRNGIDAYRPRASGHRPTVVFFYGGGWEEGDRAMYRFVGSALASAGILTFIPDYRVYPEARFPAFVEDGARAVRWALDHAGELGGDPARLVVMGHSAGAHIAAMLALDPHWLKREGVRQDQIRGLVGLAGPYDFSPDNDTRRSIFGTAPRYDRTQPISFAGASAPPAFLATGRNDRIVDPGNSNRLAARLQAAGADARVELYPRPSHESLIGAFSPALRFIAPVFRDSVAFIREVTAGAGLRRHAA